MNNHFKYPVTDYNKFPEKYYFLKIVENIIKIGNLDNTKDIILDYGCGNKIFSKMLKDKIILNYDIDPNLTEIKNFEKYSFDIVIMNHVLMYLSIDEIENLFEKIEKVNPKCKFIIGIGKQNLLSKIAKFLAFKPNAHKNTISSFVNQKSIIKKKLKINLKKNIFFLTEILFCEFL